jgi:hypothetical protein
MGIRMSSWLSRPLSLRALIGQARLAIRLFREPRVPTALKAVPVIALLYVHRLRKPFIERPLLNAVLTRRWHPPTTSSKRNFVTDDDGLEAEFRHG